MNQLARQKSLLDQLGQTILISIMSGQIKNRDRGLTWRGKAAGWPMRRGGRKCYACHGYRHIAADCPSARE